MKAREHLAVSGLVVLLLILWLGFLVHRSPGFAGTALGGLLGISGAVLMLVPLAYMVVKRVKFLKTRVTRFVSMSTLLKWHIYTGVLGPILAILHTGHKFESPLGVALTATMLIVVFSGFAGRYLMNQFSQTIKEKKQILTQLELAYRQTAEELAANPEQIAILQPFGGLLTRAVVYFFKKSAGSQSAIATPIRAIQLAQSIAGLEHSIKVHELFKKWFAFWLKIHIAVSLLLYVFLGLHIWSAIYFGLRWFD